MSSNLRIALTADLHFGKRHASGNAAIRAMIDYLQREPVDLLILAGDIGAGDDFQRCLALFTVLPCRKACVPGNHDIWVRQVDERGDSLRVYRELLPQLAAANGFHFLDESPLYFPEQDLAIVGSINWYDWSWGIDRLREHSSNVEELLRNKFFTFGRHNDAVFVRWELDDPTFTSMVVERCEEHLTTALEKVGAVIVVTHHPPFRAIDFPRPEPLSLDGLLWASFSGNTRLETVLAGRADRVPLAFCGHTHYARSGIHHGIHGHNIGGDYGWKRLLRLDWPDPTVRAYEFRSTETPRAD